ncbi:unnamed protein product [Lampetra fluviatilis]
MKCCPTSPRFNFPSWLSPRCLGPSPAPWALVQLQCLHTRELPRRARCFSGQAHISMGRLELRTMAIMSSDGIRKKCLRLKVKGTYMKQSETPCGALAPYALVAAAAVAWAERQAERRPLRPLSPV